MESLFSLGSTKFLFLLSIIVMYDVVCVMDMQQSIKDACKQIDRQTYIQTDRQADKQIKE